MKKQKNIESLLKSEDNPQIILNAMLKDFDLPAIDSNSSKLKTRKRKFVSVGTQAEQEIQVETKECVANWIFGPSPTLHPMPSDLTIENFEIISNEPTSKPSHTNFDDGSYPDDPILRQLRKRLKLLSKD